MSTRTPKDLVVEDTGSGVTIKKGTKEFSIDGAADALKAWIAFGLALDRQLDGAINAATGGGLGAMQRSYLEHQRQREGN